MIAIYRTSAGGRVGVPITTGEAAGLWVQELRQPPNAERTERLLARLMLEAR